MDSKKTTGVGVYMFQLPVLPQNRLTHYKCKKNTYKIIIKTISSCYIPRMVIQEYALDFHAKNMANQSKLELFSVGNGAT